MIYYNSNTINDWNFGDDNIIKVYRNNAVCYYKIVSSGGTSGQTPCFAVVDDITQYSDTEFEDVFNKADGKWFKLNNLNQYEEYGVYGSGRTITYYDGKLTIDDGSEYQYSGGSWVNVGEVSGSTKTSGFTIQDIGEKINTAITDGDYCVVSYYNYDFPTVPQYMMSYKNQNGHNYLNNFSGNTGSDNITQDTIIDAAVWTFESVPNSGDTWYIKNIKTNEYFGYQSRSSTQSLYLVSDSSKIGVRVVNTYQNAAGFVETASNVSGNINGYGYAINQLNRHTYMLNWWNTGSSESQYWGSDGNASFTIYKVSTGGGHEYPIYYDEMQDPPNNVSFTSMTEAEEYECPWVGMNARIDGSGYTFSGDAISGYEWVYNPSRLPAGYVEVEYIQNTGTSYLNIAFTPNQDTRVVCDMQLVTASDYPRLWGAGAWNSANGIMPNYEGGYFQMSWLGISGWSKYTSVPTSYDRKVYDVNKNYLYVDNVQIGSSTYTTKTASDPIGIFTYIGSGRPSSSSYWGKEHFKGKMFSFQVYDNGTLVRDLVPCINPNNVVGAYDLVNDVFYSVPSGYTTDTLVAGNPV